MKSTISFSIALFTIAIVLTTASPAPVTPFCVNATEKALCNEIVNDALTVADAVSNGLKFALEKAKIGEPIIDSISSKLPGDMLTTDKESIIYVCQETYEGIIEAIHRGMKEVNHGNLGIGSSVGGISEMRSCQSVLKKSNVMIPEVDKFSNDLNKVSDTLFTLLAASRTTVPPFCVNAYKKALCDEMVNGATTVVDALTNGLKVSMQKVKAGKPIIDSISSKLPSDMLTTKRESIIDTCQATYKGIIESIQEAMKNVNEHNLDIGSSVSNIAHIPNCQFALQKSNVIILELYKFSDELSWVSNTLFTILRFKENPHL